MELTPFQRNVLTVLAVIALFVLVANIAPGFIQGIVSVALGELQPLINPILTLALIAWAISWMFKKAFKGGK